jgi:hypothetical protein
MFIQLIDSVSHLLNTLVSLFVTVIHAHDTTTTNENKHDGGQSVQTNDRQNITYHSEYFPNIVCWMIYSGNTLQNAYGHHNNYMYTRMVSLCTL